MNEKLFCFAVCLNLLLLSHVGWASTSMDVAQCFNRPIQEVDLSMQLGPTKAQKGGTCYAYAAVAALEAAAYRTDGIQRNISAEAAAAHMIRQDPSNGKDWRFEQVKQDGYYLSGGSLDVMMDSLLKLDYFADSEAFRKYWDNFNLFSQGAVKSRLPHESQENDSAFDKFVNFTTARIVGRPDDIKKKWIQNDITTVLGGYERTNKPKIETEHKKFKHQILFEDYKLPEIYLEQRMSKEKNEAPSGLRGLRGLLKSGQRLSKGKKGAPSEAAEARESGLDSPVTNCGLDNPKVKSNIESIMKSLCSGIPVAAAVVMHGTKTSSYGDFSTSSVRYNGENPAWHAMLIQGVRIFNGEPHFVFRNSWDDGYSNPQKNSQAYLPFSEACKIRSASVFLTPNDPPVGQANIRCEGPNPSKAAPIKCQKITYREPPQAPNRQESH
jgi:hypothetical protein